MTRARSLAILLSSSLLVGCAAEAEVAPPPQPPPPPAAPAPPPPPPPPPPAEPAKVGKLGVFKVNARGEVELPGPVLFETGTAKLRPESDPVLEVVLAYLKAKPEVTKLRIEGHTDTDGDNKSNITLSSNRAMAVSQWLVAKGVDCRRLVPAGFGEERPMVSPEKTPEDKAQNRRVMFVNAEMEGQPVGDLPLHGGPPGVLAGDPCK